MHPLNAPIPVTRRHWFTTALSAMAGLTLTSGKALTAQDTLTHNADAIHQEAVLSASPTRVYEALLDERQFQKVQLLSGVLPAAALEKKPARISREPGGAFALFGDYISGRQIELVPNRRIVQAWRVADWPEGIYSIARFELKPQGTSTLLLFDQTGFPASDTELSAGWKTNYWAPLAKFLA